MNDYIKNEIMGTNRHQFIYGENSHERTKFLKEIEESYPVAIGQDTPSAVYIRPSFFHDNISRNADKLKLSLLANALVETVIAREIFNKIKKDISNEEFDKRASSLFKTLSMIFGVPIGSLDELLLVMNEYMGKYEECYQDICSDKENASLVYPRHLMLDMLMNSLKWDIDFKSYFAVIIDHQEKFDDFYTSAINNFVASRCNGNISMKIATHPDEWENYITSNGVFIEYVHDYGTIELDDSLKKHILRKKGNF